MPVRAPIRLRATPTSGWVWGTVMSEKFRGKTSSQRLLTCPSCRSHFQYRDFLRSRACPSCYTSLRFSVPYRIGLGIFAMAVFLCCTYEALLSRGLILWAVWWILAAPLALIAHLFFIEIVPPHLSRAGIAKCPICDGTLTRLAIRPGPFDCPHCRKQIRQIQRPSYRWARIVLCAGFAITAAKLKGFDWPFLIFVVSVYALPALFFWDILALDLFPPIRFQATKSPIQTLGIGRG